MTASRNRVKKKIYPGDNAPQHGLNGYCNYGCRCTICRAAWTTYQRYARQSRYARMVTGEFDPPHGKKSTYWNYMCRCPECMDAMRKHWNNQNQTRERDRRKHKETQ